MAGVVLKNHDLINTYSMSTCTVNIREFKHSKDQKICSNWRMLRLSDGFCKDLKSTGPKGPGDFVTKVKQIKSQSDLIWMTTRLTSQSDPLSTSF